MDLSLGISYFSITITLFFILYYFFFDKVKEYCLKLNNPKINIETTTPQIKKEKIRKEEIRKDKIKKYGEATDNEYVVLLPKDYEMV